MRKLVIEVLTTEWCKLLRVKEQTHRGMKFVKNGRVFIASNGFKLHSSTHLEERFDELYLRGRYKDKDNLIVPVPSEKWLEKLRIAVKEYNNLENKTFDNNICNVEIIE